MLLWKVIKTKDHFIWNSAARYGYLKIGLGCFYSWLDVWLFISHYCMYYSLYGSWLNHAIWLKTLFLSMMMIQLVIDRALQCFINSLQLSLFVLCDVYCSYWAMQLLFVCKVGDGIVGWWVRVDVVDIYSWVWSVPVVPQWVGGLSQHNMWRSFHHQFHHIMF